MHKFSPCKAFQLYEKFDCQILVDDFRNDPRGLFSFSKFMEVFKNLYYYADEEGKTHIIDDVVRILDGCSDQFIEKFDRHDFFTQFHWFLKRLDGMKLGPYFLEKIPPAKLVEWLRTKDTNTVELRFVFKHARSIYAKTDGTEESLYSFLRRSLDYEDAKRIFTNKRSKLYDMAITSKFGHEILANYLRQYSSEDSFLEKVSSENNLYRINESISLVESNPGLSGEQKGFVIRRILDNTGFGERMLKYTARMARKLGKDLDVDSEKERFLKHKEKYIGDFT